MDIIKETLKDVPIAIPAVTSYWWMQYFDTAVSIIAGVGMVVIIGFRVMSAYYGMRAKRNAANGS